MTETSVRRARALRNTDDEVDSLSLWQLLLLDATSNDACRELLTLYHTTSDSEAKSSVMESIACGTNFSVRELMQMMRIHRGQLDEESLRLSTPMEIRLRMCRRTDVRLRSKFIRWEVLRLMMMHGMHREAVLIDEQASGKSIRIPLRLSRLPSLTKTSNLEAVYNTIHANIFLPEVTDKIVELYFDLLRVGGAITKDVYFALMLMFCKHTLVHLSEAEIFKLISLDAPIDLNESTKARTFTRRTSSTRNLKAAADDKNAMTARTFTLLIASLAFIWIESTAISEVFLFVEGLRDLWVPRCFVLDIDFYRRYSQSPPSVENSLVASAIPVAALHSDKQLELFAREEVLRSLFIRFPMFTVGKEHVAEDRRRQWQFDAEKEEDSEKDKIRSQLALLSFGKRRRSRASRSFLASEPGWGFGVKPEGEMKRAALFDDEEMLDGEDHARPSRSLERLLLWSPTQTLREDVLLAAASAIALEDTMTTTVSPLHRSNRTRTVLSPIRSRTAEPAGNPSLSPHQGSRKLEQQQQQHGSSFVHLNGETASKETAILHLPGPTRMVALGGGGGAEGGGSRPLDHGGLYDLGLKELQALYMERKFPSEAKRMLNKMRN